MEFYDTPSQPVTNIIQVQSAENAATNPKSKKKVVKKTPAVAAPAAATAVAAAAAAAVQPTPALKEPTKTARKINIKYTLTLPSVNCISHLFQIMSDQYPVEMSYYFNSFKYRLVNRKTSVCICTFQSHLEYAELLSALSNHSHRNIHEAVCATLAVQPTGRARNVDPDESDHDSQ